MQSDPTYNASPVWRVGDLSNNITSLPIVHEDLCVASYTGKVVARWSIANVLNKFRVGFDRL